MFGDIPEIEVLRLGILLAEPKPSRRLVIVRLSNVLLGRGVDTQEGNLVVAGRYDGCVRHYRGIGSGTVIRLVFHLGTARTEQHEEEKETHPTSLKGREFG